MMESKNFLLPGAYLGMLGGGQLGGFFSEAALRMGYKVVVWDPNEKAPAKRFAEKSQSTDFLDFESADFFLNDVDAVSLEWENVPSELVQFLEDKTIVRPSSKSLALAQNRITEKTYLTKNSFPLTDFCPIYSFDDFEKVQFDMPWIVKTATLGYDGHGQWSINQVDDLQSIEGEGPWVAESKVEYLCEISVIVASDGSGKTMSFPVIENTHSENILRMSIYPARIPNKTQINAKNIAEKVVSLLGDAGVFCVEMFMVDEDTVLVNEIAPRPHNSGHLTIDAFSISQYEMQVRVLCGLPLSQPLPLGPVVMLNVLGFEMENLLKSDLMDEILDKTNCKLYMYGKDQIKNRRKLGHIIFTGTELSDLITQANFVHEKIKV